MSYLAEKPPQNRQYYIVYKTFSEQFRIVVDYGMHLYSCTQLEGNVDKTLFTRINFQ